MRRLCSPGSRGRSATHPDLGHTLRRLRVRRFVGRHQQVERLLGLRAALRLVDPVQRRFGLGLSSLGYLIQDVRGLMDPEALASAFRLHLARGLSESQRAIASGQAGLALQSPALHVQEQLLLPVDRHPQQHKDALAILLQANAEVDAIRPEVDVVLPRQGSLAPRLVFAIPGTLSRVIVVADSPARSASRGPRRSRPC